MQNDRNKQRRSIRLQNYDYKRSGAYFVTLVTQNRACLFGDVVNGRLQLNDAEQMIQAIWDQLPQHYPGVEIDAFVIMPNHVHGIIALVGVGACADIQSGGQPQGVAPTNDPRPNTILYMFCHWQISSIDSKRLRRSVMSTVSNNSTGTGLKVGFGSAIITNTSYAMKNRFIASANILATTPRDGSSIEKTHERRKPNPRTLGDKLRSGRLCR